MSEKERMRKTGYRVYKIEMSEREAEDDRGLECTKIKCLE